MGIGMEALQVRDSEGVKELELIGGDGRGRVGDGREV